MRQLWKRKREPLFVLGLQLDPYLEPWEHSGDVEPWPTGAQAGAAFLAAKASLARSPFETNAADDGPRRRVGPHARRAADNEEERERKRFEAELRELKLNEKRSRRAGFDRAVLAVVVHGRKCGLDESAIYASALNGPELAEWRNEFAKELREQVGRTLSVNRMPAKEQRE